MFLTVHSPTVRDIKTRGTVENTVVHMHPVSDNGNGILNAGVVLRILCQHNFEHKSAALKSWHNVSIIRNFLRKNGVVKLLIM